MRWAKAALGVVMSMVFRAFAPLPPTPSQPLDALCLLLSLLNLSLISCVGWSLVIMQKKTKGEILELEAEDESSESAVHVFSVVQCVRITWQIVMLLEDPTPM